MKALSWDMLSRELKKDPQHLAQDLEHSREALRGWLYESLMNVWMNNCALCSVVRMLKLIHIWEVLRDLREGLYVNTWHPQPLFSRVHSLFLPPNQGLMLKAHTQLWKCTKAPLCLPPQATVSPAGTHYSWVRATERNTILKAWPFSFPQIKKPSHTWL